ncbi:amyloid-beta A4 precursor protein-binding family A member 2-like isoform X1 [Oncorhynchus nerka]|uniref:amyloid-beta A4 precursor protein-binding family A member 2-like isoform X1 n=1 Tax=Oncorhynchus nerka TaxID=8023 RepID=UPI001130E374|nr:amyloid-beta A4 precursor protein-binding family A member 2-like isoform X1 [Oncorhynchus nerka]XP_029497229.1 amyloid-beta A4 precursor protein-binding family A member 2-like isoform X1 [Oncorhynchus nerka]
MACKQPAPVMAHRKRPGTSGSSCSMVVPPVRPLCPAAYPPEQHDQEHEEGPGEEEEVHYCRQQGLEPELTDSRPATPTTPDLEHEHEHSHDHDHPDCHDHDDHSHSDDHAECHGHEHADCHGHDHGHSHDDVDCHNHGHVHSPINDHDHAGCHGHRHDHADSLDGDSSSDYVNNTSEEEDYDEGLPEEDEGVTYYIRYCPEDDSYLEGSMDCNEAETDYTASTVQHVRAEPPGDTDECQEAVEEWAEGEGGVEVGEVRSEVVEQDPDEQIYNVLDHHPHPAAVLHESPPPTEEEEEEEEERAGVAYTGPYYGPEEDNGNSMVHIPRSPYRGRKVVVEGETGEEAEEDIDQIVAEIKMSMSMGSLSSGGTDQSPDELVQDSVPSDYHPPEAHAKPEPAPYTPTPHRHDSRPKSLNLPSSTRHNNPELQRGFKVRSRTPEERHQWAQEQMTNGAEQPRKQQRSDLNVPLENNNVPEETKKAASFPSFVDVPGPCEPEDLIDGIIFAANYLGSTQLLSERNPSKNIRMMQAQEAVSRVKRVQKAAKIKKKASPEGDAQTLTEVDLFISTLRIKVLNADTQETMMDNALRTISYIADIGNIVVLMARRRMPRTASQDCIETTPGAPEAKKQYRMICHVFESEDAQLIAQSIGQSFSVAYQEFLRANGINPEDLSQKEYSDIINTQEMYNDDLIHFSNSENCKELQLEKHKGEILGVVIVESGWGSILPTVILANMMNGGPAARSGKLSIGDQIMSINNTSLVGLPLATCQGIIKGLKNQVQVKLNIVSCPPVTTVLIKRPDLKYQLGFSVQNGIICSLMRGGIAERGGVRVGHRIIEINGQSVVATAHEKIVQALSNSVGEIHMKTMPAAMFRLLTGQETPMYI